MKQSKRFVLSVSLALAAFVFTGTAAIAQDITHPPTTQTVGPSSHAVNQTYVKNAQVIHVAGREIVLELEDGRFELLRLPPDFKFDVDGKQLSAHELTPGTKLTQEIHTVSTPQEVTTVRTVNGKVWHVSGRHVILSFPEGKNKKYTVPEDTVFHINGEHKRVWDLRKGMEIEATVVTVEPQQMVTTHTVVAGQAPPAPSVPFEGPLLIEPLVTPRAPATVAAAEPAPTELPATGSVLPVVGLVGCVFLAFYVALRITTSRQRRSTN